MTNKPSITHESSNSDMLTPSVDKITFSVGTGNSLPRPPVPKIDYDQLNPGVRGLVKELREVYRINTTDSGDGTNFKNGMGGAMEEVHVFIQVAAEDLFPITKELHSYYPEAHIDSRWSPDSNPESAFILLFPDGINIPTEYTEAKP